jgi:hypothetical protein
VTERSKERERDLHVFVLFLLLTLAPCKYVNVFVGECM